MPEIDITFPGNLAQVNDVVALRGLPSAAQVNGSLYALKSGGIYDWNPTSVSVDDGLTVIKPNDLTPLQAGRWIVQGEGIFGPELTRLSLAELKASLPAAASSLYDGSLWTWTLGNFTGQADDLNIAKADSTSLTIGAWVRQRATAVTFKAQGATVATRPVEAKLRERVSILDYKLATETDYTNAFVRALSTNKAVFFPVGDYTIAAGVDFGALKTASGVEIPVVQLTGEGHGRSRILFTGSGTFLKGGTTAPVSGGYIQSLVLDGLSIIGTGARGNSLAITYGEFTTIAGNGFAGCNSTQIAVEWEFDAASSIRNCEIAQFGTAIRTKLGYGYTIAENHIRYNMVGLDIRTATTTANIVGNTIERNGIGVGLWIASLIHFEQNAIQGNYAGSDVVSYNWNTLISFHHNYFEASPHVFYHNGDSGGSFTSNNYSFVENKGLAVEIVDNLQFASFVRNRMQTFSVGTSNVGRITVEDNTADANDGLAPFTNYAGAGAPLIRFRDAPFKAVQTYDPPSLAAGASDSVNIAVSGAVPGMEAGATLTTIVPGVIISAEVTATDTVHVRLYNMSGGVVDIASGTLKTLVRRA